MIKRHKSYLLLYLTRRISNVRVLLNSLHHFERHRKIPCPRSKATGTLNTLHDTATGLPWTPLAKRNRTEKLAVTKEKEAGHLARPLVCVLFLVNQPNYSVTARPYCCAWSAGIVSGLGASTFSHGPFTVGAACASAFSALKIIREVRVPTRNREPGKEKPRR